MDQRFCNCPNFLKSACCRYSLTPRVLSKPSEAKNVTLGQKCKSGRPPKEKKANGAFKFGIEK